MASWYLARNPRAAERFQAAPEACIAAIVEAPTRFPEFETGVSRRLVGHRFPYAVVYRVARDEVQVIAVMHLRRRPAYWRDA